MKRPPFDHVDPGDPESTSRVAGLLNSGPRGDWRIVEYSPARSRLILSGSAGERQLYVMCLGTCYVRSQVYIPSPVFAMEIGRKKMLKGMLSSRCYDSSIMLTMDDGVNVHEIICERITAGEINDRRIHFPDRNP